MRKVGINNGVVCRSRDLVHKNETRTEEWDRPGRRSQACPRSPAPLLSSNLSIPNEFFAEIVLAQTDLIHERLQAQEEAGGSDAQRCDGRPSPQEKEGHPKSGD